MTDRTMDRARGRWRDILPALGIPSQFLNGKHQPCPLCGGKDRARFTDRSGNGDYFCSQCGAGLGLRLLMQFHKWDFRRTVREVDGLIGNAKAIIIKPREARMPNRIACRQLWESGSMITAHDPAGRYLASRGIEATSPYLRFIPGMKHPNGNAYPGMAALFHSPEGKAWTLHRTFLTEDGGKADVDPVRLFMPGQIAKGGSVWLRPPENTIGIAEGIESALSASTTHRIPVWAALNEGLLRAWQPPKGIKRVIIFGDHDENFVGQAAAYDLAKRLHREKFSVEVKIPTLIGYDWNDVLCEAMG